MLNLFDHLIDGLQKYSKWADKAGVNPFVPCKSLIPSGTGSRSIFFITSILVAVPRLLLSALAILTISIAAIIFDMRFVGFTSLLYGILAYFLPEGRSRLQHYALHFSVGALFLLVRLYVKYVIHFHVC